MLPRPSAAGWACRRCRVVDDAPAGEGGGGAAGGRQVLLLLRAEVLLLQVVGLRITLGNIELVNKCALQNITFIILRLF